MIQNFAADNTSIDIQICMSSYPKSYERLNRENMSALLLSEVALIVNTWLRF